MADRSTDRSESAATNRMVRETMETIAERMGLAELPLNNPTINFYQIAKAQLRDMGWKGQNLDHTTYKVIGTLVHTITGNEGSLFAYPKADERWQKTGKPPLSFDQYFRMAVKQKGGQLRKREMEKQGRLPGNVPITPGSAEDAEGGISESLIPGGESGADAAARADQLAHQARVFAGIPRMLSDKLGGEALVLIWDMLKSGDYTMQEMAAEMTEKEIPTIEGGPWTTGVVSRAKMKIINYVKQYLQIKGIDWGSFEI